MKERDAASPGASPSQGPVLSNAHLKVIITTKGGMYGCILPEGWYSALPAAAHRLERRTESATSGPLPSRELADGASGRLHASPVAGACSCVAWLTISTAERKLLGGSAAELHLIMRLEDICIFCSMPSILCEHAPDRSVCITSPGAIPGPLQALPDSLPACQGGQAYLLNQERPQGIAKHAAAEALLSFCIVSAQCGGSHMRAGWYYCCNCLMRQHIQRRHGGHWFGFCRCEGA